MMESTGLDRHVDPGAVNTWLERRRASRFQTMTQAEGNRWIARTIADGQPAAIGKIGDRECCALAAHLGLRQFYKYTWTPPSYGEADLHRQAGVFPPVKETYARFSDLYLQRLQFLDGCAVWRNPGESQILARHSPSARRMELRALDPYFFEEPWSARLAGKRVLVIHPFATSIGSQFARRKMVWQDAPRVLPDFEIELIRAPYGFEQNEFSDWFQMLRWMEEQMEEAYQRGPFDVALIGCGAAGVPLAVKARHLGAIGIHMGGPLQLLFGIRGRRWDQRPEFHDFYNEHWIRPLPHETPECAPRVDRGGYW